MAVCNAEAIQQAQEELQQARGIVDILATATSHQTFDLESLDKGSLCSTLWAVKARLEAAAQSLEVGLQPAQ